MEVIMDSESNRIKLEHSYSLIADALKHLKVEDDRIVIKDEVFGEDEVKQNFHVDVSSVDEQFKSYSLSNSTALQSEVSYEESDCQTDCLELEYNCDVVNSINPCLDRHPKQILKCQQNYEVGSEEMKTGERICRLCFQMCDKFKTIDGDIKSVLDVLVSEIDIEAVRDPVMCTLCAKILFECFDFKIRCLYMHNYLIPFVNKRNGGKLNLKDIYMTKNKTNKSIPEDEEICGFCMNPAKNGFVIFIDDEERENMLKKTLEQCVPELDLSIVKKPVICTPCNASLEKHFRFVTNVLIAEEKIKKYRESLDINSKSEIELSRLFQCITGITYPAGDNGGDIIKSEQSSCESVNTDVEDERNNSMDIDDLKSNEQTFTPKNILNSEIESNELGAIEIKESFCGGTSIDFKEEDVEVEDQKVLLNEEIEIKTVKTDELDLTRFKKGIVMAPQEVITRINGKQECYILPNLDDNLLKPHTFMKKNVTNIRTFKTENQYCLKTLLLQHKNSSKLYKCNLCSFRTKYKYNLKMHLLKHKDLSEITTYKCDSCRFQTMYKNCLKTHLLKHQNPAEVTMHKCVSCDYQTKYKSYLKTHLLKHKNPSEVTIYKCSLCVYQTVHKNALRTHLLKHKNTSRVTMYGCDSCLYKTKFKSELERHLLKHNPSNVKMYRCEFCLYQTKYESKHEDHLLKHEKSTPEVAKFKCELCVYQTRHKHSFKTHLLKHMDISEVTMFKCDLCVYQTKHKGNLKKHLLKHKDISEVKMYKCDSCWYQTKYKNSLKTHILTHMQTSECVKVMQVYFSLNVKDASKPVLTNNEPSKATV